MILRLRLGVVLARRAWRGSAPRRRRGPAGCRTARRSRPPARPRSCRISPWSTKTQVSCSPIALWTSSAATEESTPPERPQITLPSPTWARIFSTCSSITDAGDHCSLAAGDVAQEAGEDLGPVGRVDDLGVELDPVEAAVGHLAGGDRRAGARGERGEALAAPRRPRRGGSSSSSAPRAGRRAGVPPPSGRVSSVRPNSPASAAFDPAAERQRPSPACRNRCRAPGCRARAARSGSARRPRLVDRGGAAGEHQRLRRPLADLLDVGGRAAAARRRRRIRGSAGRSAASTGRRSRGPAPPRWLDVDRRAPRRLLGRDDDPLVVGGRGDRRSSSCSSRPRRRRRRRPRRGRSSPCRRTARSAASCPRVISAGATITSARWKERMSS